LVSGAGGHRAIGQARERGRPGALLLEGAGGTMRRDGRGATDRGAGVDRGVSIVEWGGMLLVLAGITVALAVTTDVPERVQRGIRAAICEVFQGSGCQLPGGTQAGGGSGADRQSGPTATGNPVTNFLGGGAGRAAGSARSAACMLHLCGGGPFGAGWNNAAAAVNPSDEQRFNCQDWAEAEGARPTRPDGSQRERTTVGQFNMYGNVGNHGEIDEVVPAIENSVDDRQPTFLSLNEACRSQVEELDRRLEDYQIHFAPIQRYDADGNLGGVECDDGSAYGNAVVYRTDFANDIVREPAGYDLGTPHYDHEDGNERRGAVCVSSASKGTAYCAVHLTAEEGEDGDDARETEIENLNENLERDFPGQTILMGGDFNATPGSDVLDAIYDPRYGGDANGRFKEVDSTNGFLGNCRSGESTAGRDGFFGSLSGGNKIDYIFTTPDVEVHDADSTGSGVSDHDPLWSEVTF
jgi:endonuclease/exonuclease/phosphatase family metal-dependent hydrolase